MPCPDAAAVSRIGFILSKGQQRGHCAAMAGQQQKRRRVTLAGVAVAAGVLGWGCTAAFDCPGEMLAGRAACPSDTRETALAAFLLYLAATPARGPQFAFVTSTGTAGNDTLSAYRISEQNGNLIHLSDYTVQADPYDLTVDQTGRFLYVMNSASNTISQFRIDRSTGALTSIAAPFASVTTPFAGPTLLNGTQLYVPSGAAVNNLGRYSIDSNGALTFQENVAGPAGGSQVWYMRGTADSRFLYATIYNNASVAQYSVNSNTGGLSPLGTPTIATGTNPWSIEVDASGRFAYVTNYGATSVSQYSINTTSGQLTALSPSTVGSGTQPVGLAIHPSSTFVYVGNNGSGTVSQYRVEGTTGALTPLSPATVTASGAYGLAVDRDGRYAYVCDAGAARIHQFAIGSDGTLSAQSPATAVTGSECRFVAIVG